MNIPIYPKFKEHTCKVVSTNGRFTLVKHLNYAKKIVNSMAINYSPNKSIVGSYIKMRVSLDKVNNNVLLSIV